MRIIFLSLLDFTGRQNLLVFKTWSASLVETRPLPTSHTVSELHTNLGSRPLFKIIFKTFVRLANGAKSLSLGAYSVHSFIKRLAGQKALLPCVSVSKLCLLIGISEWNIDVLPLLCSIQALVIHSRYLTQASPVNYVVQTLMRGVFVPRPHEFLCLPVLVPRHCHVASSLPLQRCSPPRITCTK